MNYIEISSKHLKYSVYISSILITYFIAKLLYINLVDNDEIRREEKVENITTVLLIIHIGFIIFMFTKYYK